MSKKPETGPGSGKRAPAFVVGDPRASRGGKALKKKRIGRESALATCRRMNFDGLENLILFAQGNEEALNMAPGSITGSMRLNATKETLTYIMTKKQVVTVAPDVGNGAEQGAMQIMVVAPNNTKAPSVLELDDKDGTVIPLDLSAEDLALSQEYDDGVLSDDLLSEDGDFDLNGTEIIIR